MEEAQKVWPIQEWHGQSVERVWPGNEDVTQKVGCQQENIASFAWDIGVAKKENGCGRTSVTQMSCVWPGREEGHGHVGRSVGMDMQECGVNGRGMTLSGQKWENSWL